MKYKVFVDGQEGTTGLQIHERLAARPDLDILAIDPGKRKDPEARRALIHEADIVFLCLPDEAARESVALAANTNTRIIDASTAHRTHPDWTYGLPELSKAQREAIGNSRRLSNPGCHATGFALSLYPLVREGIVAKDYPVSCTSLTGYSGGGKKLIATFEGGSFKDVASPMHYALKLNHKHLPEMQKIAGLAYPPVFAPVIANFYKGMAVSIPLLPRLLGKKMDAAAVHDFLSSYYASERFVRVMPFASEAGLAEGFLNAEACNDTNRAEIFVFGHEEQILLVTRFDNLGKGASGAAVQNMNIMLGLEEGIGLQD